MGRVDELLARMTVEEKVAQLGCVWSTALVAGDDFSEERARAELPHGTGHITRIAASTGLLPRENAAFHNRVQRFCVERTRLGIPAIVHEEAVAGFCARGATVFPQAIGLAATWEPALIGQMGEVVRTQMLAVGARQALSPVLELTRDVRWGRTEETYGEDRYLAARMGVAYVRGVQGGDLRGGVACTGKHFVAYGASEGGFNHAPAHVGPRELREVYAYPFAAAIHEGRLASVMNAYNEVDGLPCGGSRAILTDLLRGELGFEGVVVADYYTTQLLHGYHHVSDSRAETAKLALRAGLDVELPQRDCYDAPLVELVTSGELAAEILDTAVRRALTTKIELGLFDDPFVDEHAADGAYDTPSQRELARTIAEKSMVLLRNADDLLPLDRGVASVAVIGPAADDRRLLEGDYHYPAHLEIISASGDGILPEAGGAFAPGPYYPEMVTPLAAIRDALGASRVVHAPGCEVSGEDRSGIAGAVEAAQRAEVAVVCVGGRSGLTVDATSGEFRDSATLALPGLQRELVEAVVATGTPTVVVVISGRVHALSWLSAPVLLYAWLPGEEGGRAISDVLFGTTNPSGRLPISLPRAVGQVPVTYSHKTGSGGSQIYRDYVDLPASPLYPFGHGLSYTRFGYTGLGAEAGGTSETIEVAVEVSNAGSRDGEEVVQLYAHDEVASVTRPARQLVGFTRVALGAGERRTVRFRLDPTQLALFDPDMRFVVEPGAVRLFVGGSSQATTSTTIEMTGPVREIGWAEVRPTEVVWG